jgi:hypothetical protein
MPPRPLSVASHACCLQPPAGAAGGRRCRQAGSGGGCSSQRRTAGRPGNVAAHAAGSMCWCKAAPCWCQSRLEEVGGWWVCELSPSARTSQQGDPAEMYPEGSRTVVPINHAAENAGAAAPAEVLPAAPQLPASLHAAMHMSPAAFILASSLLCESRSYDVAGIITPPQPAGRDAVQPAALPQPFPSHCRNPQQRDRLPLVRPF